ncbi:helix-turn-helix transcriptional regulator [Paenibacillus nasutitermitis]|uniref:helix-turn-helix transcriptional regulator n=1 Tax=Paenibacillus nasutitermitis TaxID=1652958 RepID=UPI0035715E80
MSRSNCISDCTRNIHEEITLQMMSDNFSINPTYFSRLFKTVTGQGLSSMSWA